MALFLWMLNDNRIIHYGKGFNRFQPYIILKGSGKNPNQAEITVFKMKTELKSTDFWVGKTITALVTTSFLIACS